MCITTKDTIDALRKKVYDDIREKYVEYVIHEQKISLNHKVIIHFTGDQICEMSTTRNTDYQILHYKYYGEPIIGTYKNNTILTLCSNAIELPFSHTKKVMEYYFDNIKISDAKVDLIDEKLDLSYISFHVLDIDHEYRICKKEKQN